MAHFQTSRRLRIVAAALLLVCTGGGAIWALTVPVVAGTAQVRSVTLLAVFGALTFAALLLLILVSWPETNPAPAAQIEVLTNGLEPGDLALLPQLFPQSREARLTPIAGGYSGAAVFQAQSWDAGGALQRPSVVKVGSATKIQPELDNYGRYVREYVGNTATLLESAQHGTRVAARWAYAGFSGAGVTTLADHAAAGGDLVQVLHELFAPGSTLGALLGAPRRDPARALYQEYAWSPRDWQRIVQASSSLLGGKPWRADLPGAAADQRNPLPLVARWFGQETSPGERAALLFDVPIAMVHGDLNSRNILLDQRGAVFVIDFSHTGPGHLLRDFARLEAELLLAIDQPADETAARQRAEAARAALRRTDGRPCQTLRELLEAGGGNTRTAQAVSALRRHAHDYAGLWLSGPAAPYLIALLHTVLDTVRYAQTSAATRYAALLLASAVCHELERTTYVLPLE